MVRKITIALAAIAFVGVMSASMSADARMGGFGGGFHGATTGGGFHRGMSTGGFRHGFVGPRSFAFRHGFASHFNRVAFTRFHHFQHFQHFHHRLFAFAPVPFAVGAGFSCWSRQPTPWGWRRVWVCGRDF